MTRDKKITITVSLEADLLAEIDSAAKRDDLSRSQYFRRLARNDLKTGEQPLLPHLAEKEKVAV